MKKIILSQISIILFLFCTFFINAEYVGAYNDYNINFGETIFIKSDYGNESVDINGIHSKKIKITVVITDVSVYSNDGNDIDDTVKISFAHTSDKEWYVKTGEQLTFTDYIDEYNDSIYFSTDSLNDFSFNLSIIKISEAELTISCHKPITMKDTGSKKVYLTVYYGDEDVSEFVDLKVKASKKYFVDIETLVEENYFYLKGNNQSGKCKITVTAKYKGQSCSDSFTLNIKSTLKKKLYILGELFDYNTRNNTFIMLLTNRSKKNIKIYSDGAVALDSDYVTFDRNVKLSKNRKDIIIKPGKEKTIYWNVIGNTTWYNIDDFELQFKCIYEGKVYMLSVLQDSVYVLKNGKWKRMS